MIAIAGGTGRLGTQVVKLLTARGLPLRIITRSTSRDSRLEDSLIQVFEGDVRDEPAMEHALAGASTLISAIHGFDGRGADSPRSIDFEGNRTLFRAARTSGVEHVILISVHQASAEHPMELFRMKYAAEQSLRESGLSWTIIRPTAFMETWMDLVGAPLVNTGKTRLFGGCSNPINFVSVEDVARYVELAVSDTDLRENVLEVGGPENLSFREFIETFASVIERNGSIRRVPLPMMRVMTVAMRRVNPTLARLIQAAIVMDTERMTFDPTETLQRYPSITLTSLADAVRRDYVSIDPAPVRA